MKIEILKL